MQATVRRRASAYVTGDTNSANFPTTPGALQTTPGGKDDAFVSKLNSSGTALLYSSYLSGGAGFHHLDVGYGIAVDSAHNAYVTGSTSSATFPVSTGALQPTYAGNTDAFISEIRTSP